MAATLMDDPHEFSSESNLPWLDVQGNQSGVRIHPPTLMGEFDRQDHEIIN